MNMLRSQLYEWNVGLFDV